MVDFVYSADNIEYDKVACLDLGGTLVESHGASATAHEINTSLGMSPETDEEIFRLNKDSRGVLGDYIYHAAVVTDILRQSEAANLGNYGEACQDILESREVIDSGPELVNELEKEGYHTIATSSAPKAVTIPLAEDLGISSVYVFRDWLFDEEGDFERLYVDPDSRYGKQDFVKSLQENGTEVFYAGNGGNDVRAVEQSDIGVKRWDWVSKPTEAVDETLETLRKEAKI